jgi:hypothetical protein
VCAVTGLPLAWQVETARRNESLYAAPLLDAVRARLPRLARFQPPRSGILRRVNRYGIPWCNEPGRTAESIVRLDAKCLGLRVRLESGERVTMPLRPVTFVMRFPPDFANPS